MTRVGSLLLACALVLLLVALVAQDHAHARLQREHAALRKMHALCPEVWHTPTCEHAGSTR